MENEKKMTREEFLEVLYYLYKVDPIVNYGVRKYLESEKKST